MNYRLRIFRLLGVDVFIDWSWLLVAAILLSRFRDHQGLFTGKAHGIGYQVAFLFSYMLIVLLHEFGHVLACQWVGGRATGVTLTFFGGATGIVPPQRAAAMLWSITGGPLVNMILLPLTVVPALYLYRTGHADNVWVDLLGDVGYLNLWLLAFNLLPIYPLDGGQILRSLLWFVCGRGMSLILAGILGLVGCALLLVGAVWMGWVYMAIMVGFMGLQCFGALQAGAAIRKLDQLPRHQEATCPQCGQHPPIGPHWRCACGMAFDTFSSEARCPACGNEFETTACPLCRNVAPRARWYATGGFPLMGESAPPTEAGNP